MLTIIKVFIKVVLSVECPGMFYSWPSSRGEEGHVLFCFVLVFFFFFWGGSAPSIVTYKQVLQDMELFD